MQTGRQPAGHNSPPDSRQSTTPSSSAPQEKSFQGTPPAISLPKGGGAIRGMGEKFAANPVTGTGSMSVPIATSPGRSGFGPQLALSYDSGAGNGPFGFGWSLSIPSITRKTDKGLPKYHDADDSDVFILSGAEDLVPVLVKNGAGQWVEEDVPDREMYELALHCGRQAERAYNYERGHTSKVFISGDGWDNLHEGLLAGDRLHLALRQMEKSYLDCNVREYELTKHCSLRRDFPWAFLLLRTTGYCEFEIPEWMFDRANPGHYMRRIKNVSLTIPAVAGPYTSVNCRLTLLSSTTRVSPVLVDPPAGCCPANGPDNPYEPVPDDPRFVKEYAATEAIATSSGNSDTGMFELNFRDERYLPYEYRGTISRWRLELRPQNNDFDVDTLSDVILHLNFMAREGGDNLRAAADHVAQRTLPGGGLQYLDIKREIPSKWHRFTAGLNASGRAELNIQLTRKMFPYLFGNKRLFVQKLAILFEAPGAVPSAHRIVELWVDKEGKPIRDESRRCDVYSIHCLATETLPGLFHGVLPIELGPIPEGGKLDLGAFKFGADVEEVSELFIIFDYVAR